MADRPGGFGLTAETHAKIASKYNKELEVDIRKWMAGLVGESLPIDDAETPVGGDKMHEVLKDGVYLCKLINAIQPGSVKKINESKMAFKQMENIGFFLAVCEKIGVHKADLFQTVDLYDNTNMTQVICAIDCLRRKSGK